MESHCNHKPSFNGDIMLHGQKKVGVADGTTPILISSAITPDPSLLLRLKQVKLCICNLVL